VLLSLISQFDRTLVRQVDTTSNAVIKALDSNSRTALNAILLENKLMSPYQIAFHWLRELKDYERETK